MRQLWTCHCGQHNAGPGPCAQCLNPAPAGLGTEARPMAARARRGPAMAVLSVVTAILLVAGVGTAAWRVRLDRGTGAAGDPASRTLVVGPDSVPAEGAGPLEQELPGLMRFVQEARGLAFKGPVRVELLSDRDFRARLAAERAKDEDKDAADIETTGRVLQGLGLLDRDVDLGKATKTLLGAAVAGFYDPESDDLVVRGESLTPGVRVTLVHELTHALQDQHFDIRRVDLDDADDESPTGLTGLVEGDAVRVQEIYRASLPLAEQKAAEAEEAAAAGGLGAGVPQVLLQLLAFPYAVGPTFVKALVDTGGQARLDDAFARPPTTSGQLLHPEDFLSGRPVIAVPTPPADGQKLDEGVLGELGLILLLNSSGTSGVAAAEGWAGDRYVAWRKGDRTCVRTMVTMGSVADTAELRAGFERLAAKRDIAVLQGSASGPLTFTTCG